LLTANYPFGVAVAFLSFCFLAAAAATVALGRQFHKSGQTA
jgi:hypothetical protein